MRTALIFGGEMFSLKGKLTFININQDYLKYLHDFCSEVYYKPIGYERKPYIGILVQGSGLEYVSPLSSAKEKHKAWKNVEADRFLIYENCDKSFVATRAVCKENGDGSMKHILSVIDLKKMIPIKDGLYTKVDLTANSDDTVEVRNYKNLMNKEFAFCVKILSQIIQKASKLYEKQMATKKFIKFCCDFQLFEEKCGEYEV